jgi:ABC-type antimicrobial peptide transport system permease subunit
LGLAELTTGDRRLATERNVKRPRFEIGENARMALGTLRMHKMRSFLTVLGVVIGVAALIAVASILVGLDADMKANLSAYGTDTLFVFRFNMGVRVGRMTAEERQRKPITLEDALAMRDECPAVQAVTVNLYPRFGGGGGFGSSPSARAGSREVSGIDYSGTLPSYPDVLNTNLYRGRFFNDSEDQHRVDIAVVGYDLAEGLFPGEDPIGKEILVSGTLYHIVGVMEKRKGQFFRDEGADKMVLVPYRTYKRHNPAADEHFVMALARPGMKAVAEDQIRGLLRRRRNVAPNKPDNFGITSTEQVTEQVHQITWVVALITVIISSIGLLVGGVGVMNIMLMSVTERTREIGVRKAMGARRADIIRQFLTEAITLTGAGGVIGMLLGIGFSTIVTALVPALPTSVPAWAVVMGVLVSMSVGLFFGMYPAMKAARLDPVEALRYE